MAARRRWGSSPLRVAAIGSLVGLFVVASSWADVSAITRGIVTTVLTVALVASLEVATGGLVRAALSLPPVVYLGQISYGTYLWHWLVIMVLLDRFTLAPPVVAFAASVIASALAAVSYHLLEMPVRESRWLDQRRLSVVGAGLAASVLIGVVVAPAALNRGDDAAPVVVAGGTAVDGGEEIPADLDWRGALEDRGNFPICSLEAPEQCTLVEGPPGAPHILLMGDSHARMYIPALTTLAEERGYTLSAAVAPGCPWQRGILRAGEGPIGTEVQDLGPPCRAHHDEWYDTIIPGSDPDLVIGANQPWDDPQSTRQIEDEELGPVRTGSKRFLNVVRNRTRSTVEDLLADGRQVILLEPVPVAGEADNPITCLSEATRFDECEFQTGTDVLPVENAYREIAADHPDDVFSLDIDRAVCPGTPTCAPLIDGLIVRWDPAHLTQRFVVTLAPRFGDALDDLSLLG